MQILAQKSRAVPDRKKKNRHKKEEETAVAPNRIIVVLVLFSFSFFFVTILPNPLYICHDAKREEGNSKQAQKN